MMPLVRLAVIKQILLHLGKVRVTDLTTAYIDRAYANLFEDGV